MNKVGRHVELTNFEEDTFSVRGTGVFHKDVVTKVMKITGHCQLKGKLIAKELVNRGTVILKSGNIEHLKNIGSLNADRIESSEIHTFGYFKCKNEVTTNTIRSKGTIKIKHLYARNHIHLNVGTACKIDTITCQNDINVKAFFLPTLFKKLTAETIEGSDIHLENTVARHVIGENITIGPNCKINKITYKNNLTIHHQSSVFSSQKI